MPSISSFGPIPTSAETMALRMGLPLCADAPERAKNTMMNAATSACSAVPHIFAIVSSRMRERRCAPPLRVQLLFVHFVTWHDAAVVGGVRVLNPDFLSSVLLARHRI